MLPQQEIDRIHKEGDKINIHSQNCQWYIHGAKLEAATWYERMGKFAEWVVDNGWKRVNFMTKDVKWYNTEHRRQASHAELINEFLKQENKEK